MFFKQSLAVVFAVFALSLNAPAQTAPDLSALCLQYKPYSIDISSLADFYETLSPDEKEEQLRDWAYYGLLVSLGIKQSEINELTGMDFPMRYPSLKDKYKFPVSQGRSLCPDNNDCVILVAGGESENRLLQGFIYDKQRMPAGDVPERVHIFAYSVDPAGKTINTFFVRTVPGSVFLSPEYGYFEKEITNAESLKEFLAAANDIVSAKIRKGSLILGGRKNAFGAQASLTCEDVAVLQQAYIIQASAEQEKERRKSYDVFISQKYSEILKKDKNLRKAIKKKKVKYSEIITQIRKAFPYTLLDKIDSNVGFSLDPIYDFDAMVDELNNLAERKGKFLPITAEMAVSKAIDSHLPAILALAAKVKSRRDITPLLKFRRGLKVYNNIADLQLDSALQMIELDNTYQTARYDGKMKGTSAAMILFYTDLTAKLWALDYNGTAPKNSITGFRGLTEIKVPKLYWRDFIKLSKTRLWFGLRGDSFDINDNDIFFEPVSARVYAASSDPLYPGKESKPNYQSAEFLGWWDAHYAAVADFEPYYYKLNELLKWSCIMMVLKEKNSHCLDFLKDEPVTRTLDFEAWYKSSAQLKNKTDLPYVDGSKFNKTTECFKMLESKGYPMMGTTYFVSGGVSLASKKDIISKISKHKKGGGTGRKAVANKPAKRGIKYAREPANGKKSVKVSETNPEKSNFGDFSAAAGDRSLKLQWNKNEGAVLDECVNTLADVQMRAGREGRNEGIFKGSKDFQKVVRIELGKTYLIRSGSLKDKWIYVLVDPDGKTEDFPAKAAGTEPDSSVFYAKTVPTIQAEKIIQQSKSVTLFE